jgi:hypothetical protein
MLQTGDNDRKVNKEKTMELWKQAADFGKWLSLQPLTRLACTIWIRRLRKQSITLKWLQSGGALDQCIFWAV